MTELWLFRTARSILFGNDATEKIGEELKRLNKSNALVITDR